MEATNIAFEYKEVEIKGWFMLFSKECYQLKMTVPYVIEETIFRQMPNPKYQISPKAKEMAKEDLIKIFNYAEVIRNDIEKFECILDNYCHLQRRLTEIEVKGIFITGIMTSKDFYKFTAYAVNQYYRILFEKAFEKDSIEYTLHKKVGSLLLEKIIYAVKNPGIDKI